MFDLEFEITKAKEDGTTRDVFLCRGRLGCMRKNYVIKRIKKKRIEEK